MFFSHRDGDLDRQLGRRIARGVGHQVAQHLPQANAVAPHARRQGRDIDSQGLLFGRQHRCQLFAHVMDDIAHVELFQLQVDLSPRDARHVEQVFGQPSHDADLTLDQLTQLAQLGIVAMRGLDHFGRHGQRGQGIAQFVRERCQEGILLRVHAHQVFPRLHQFRHVARHHEQACHVIGGALHGRDHDIPPARRIFRRGAECEQLRAHAHAPCGDGLLHPRLLAARPQAGPAHAIELRRMLEFQCNFSAGIERSDGAVEMQDLDTVGTVLKQFQIDRPIQLRAWEGHDGIHMKYVEGRAESSKAALM